VPLADVPRLVREGRIDHALVIAGLHLHQLIRGGDVRQDREGGGETG
jgi:hypothetical protein